MYNLYTCKYGNGIWHVRGNDVSQILIQMMNISYPESTLVDACGQRIRGKYLSNGIYWIKERTYLTFLMVTIYYLRGELREIEGI